MQTFFGQRWNKPLFHSNFLRHEMARRLRWSPLSLTSDLASTLKSPICKHKTNLSSRTGWSTSAKHVGRSGWTRPQQVKVPPPPSRAAFFLIGQFSWLTMDFAGTHEVNHDAIDLSLLVMMNLDGIISFSVHLHDPIFSSGLVRTFDDRAWGSRHGTVIRVGTCTVPCGGRRLVGGIFQLVQRQGRPPSGFVSYPVGLLTRAAAIEFCTTTSSNSLMTETSTEDADTPQAEQTAIAGEDDDHDMTAK